MADATTVNQRLRSKLSHVLLVSTHCVRVLSSAKCRHAWLLKCGHCGLCERQTLSRCHLWSCFFLRSSSSSQRRRCKFSQLPHDEQQSHLFSTCTHLSHAAMFHEPVQPTLFPHDGIITCTLLRFPFYQTHFPVSIADSRCFDSTLFAPRCESSKLRSLRLGHVL